MSDISDLYYGESEDSCEEGSRRERDRMYAFLPDYGASYHSTDKSDKVEQMKSEKTLTEKLSEAKSEIQGVAKIIDDLTETAALWGTYYSTKITDKTYLKTDKYDILAFKMCRESGQEFYESIRLDGWLTILYKQKGSDEIKKIQTPRMLIKDDFTQKKDLTSLEKFKYAGVKYLGDDKIEASWLDSKGIKGPRYELKLE